MSGRSDRQLDPHASIWAKSWPMDGAPEEWLPLWQHLDDAADVAGRLWDEWLAPSIRHVIASTLPGGEADGRALVVWLAGCHDVGKATPAFACQVPVLSDRMRRAGLTYSATAMQDRSQLRHEVAGAVIVERNLAETVTSRFRRKQYGAIVAGHHGAFPTERVVIDGSAKVELLGDAAWQRVQDALFARALERSGAGERLSAWSEVRLPAAAQLILTGVIIMADWISSNSAYFPLHPVTDVPMVPGPHHEAGRLNVAWRRLDLDRRWRPAPHDDIASRFEARFGRPAKAIRPVQRMAGQLAETMACPGLMIVEAPMGEGKTEAAFLAAEVLAARGGCTGTAVALPTQATSNAMFDRMLAWLERLPDHDAIGTQSVGLMHGKAALNDTYRGLILGNRGRTQIFGEGYEDAENTSKDPISPSDKRFFSATANDFTRGRKRTGLSSFVVCTIDQVLFDALIAKHLVLRQLSLAGKVVIVDEVHAADVFMSVFLDRALEWLAAAGTPVVLLSATLPAARRAELYTAYERGRRAHNGLKPPNLAEQARITERLSGDIGYPSIVTSDDDGPAVTSLEPSGRQTEIQVRRLVDDLGTLGDLLEDKLSEGGTAVVIRNTVTRVQEAAEYLAERFGGDAVSVAHARFLAIDRQANDAELLAKFGPPGDGVARPHRHIVVASQVVEQSLDLDFDLMITDIAPVDLVLQRMGRLHRHARGQAQSDRPPAVRNAQCYVTGVDWSATPPEPVRGCSAIYGPWPLYRALAVLDDRLDGLTVVLPDDIAPLVQDAYGSAPVPLDWEDAVSRAADKFADRQAQRQSHANDYALQSVSSYRTSFYGLSHGGHGEIDEDSPQAQATVRDGEESIEVVVLQHGPDGDRIVDWYPERGGELLPLRHVPIEADQERILARCTLRLPLSLTNDQRVDAVLDELGKDYFEGWQRAYLLKGQLALVLDDDGERGLAGNLVRYDRRLGLIVEPET